MTRNRRFDNVKNVIRIKEENPWLGIFVGLTMIVGSVLLYDFFVSYDFSNPDSLLEVVVKVCDKLKLIYILPVLFAFVGIYNVFFGIRDILQPEKQE